MIAPKLKNFLEKNDIRYRTIPHTAAYTAQQTAEMAHVSGLDLVKAVMVKVDGKIVMVVEPANLKINLKEFSKLIGAKKAELATESEFKDQFPDIEVGAMPPIGQLYGVETFMDDAFKSKEKVVFNGGSHTDLVEMNLKDFERIAKPNKLHLPH